MLGEEIGLSQQVVSRMERDRSKIQVDVLINLADYFHVSTDCVLGYYSDRDGGNPDDTALKMQGATCEDLTGMAEGLEHMDPAKRQAIWNLLMALKRYL